MRRVGLGELAELLDGLAPHDGGVAVGGYRVETTDGAWQQLPNAWIEFEEDYGPWSGGAMPPADNIEFETFIGEGAYRGLTAVVQDTSGPSDSEGMIRFDGYVFEGDLWEAPEPWVP